MSKIEVSALRWAPPFAQGLTGVPSCYALRNSPLGRPGRLMRDLRVRRALEEAGLAYEERPIGPEDQKSDAYRKLQPFAQVPTFERDGLALFESGAIVMHIAEQSAALMPAEPDARARVKTWMFAALNTVEPPITMLNVIDLQPGGVAQGLQALRATVVGRIQTRLDSLAAFLDRREHLLEGRFTAADLLLTTVLRILRTTDLVARMPALEAYRLRCEARPAFGKALAAQMANFAANAPPQG